MQTGVSGAGAVGGHLAARLGAAGHAIARVARGADLEALRARGATERREHQTVTSRVRASDRPADLGRQDIGIGSVDAAVLPDMAASIGPLLRPGTAAVVFARDGVPWWQPLGSREGHPPPDLGLPSLGDELRRAVGEHRTIGWVIHPMNALVEPGMVTNDAPRSDSLLVGGIDDAASARVPGSKAAIESAGLDSSVTPDPDRGALLTLARNMAVSVLCALTGQTAEAAAENPVLSLVLRGAIAEASAVADAYGAGSTLHSPACGGAPDHKPSFLEDLELGRPMEVDAFVGELLAFARSSSIETPLLERLSAIAVRRAIGAGLCQEAA